ncbi:hypothetical protein PS15p_200566 [Mucor circinelloides]
MSNFVTAKEQRRVFMKGDDGHLYELHLVWVDNTPKDGSLTCLTMNPILRYLTMFFKSPPVASVKSLVLDEAGELLYMLLSDSSIHVAQIRGTTYSLLKRYESQNLESIQLVQDTKKPCLMAVAKNGDRMFLQSENLDIQLVFTRPAPPLPGSILFNGLTDQHAYLSFYRQGIFASVLSKSERKYFVLTSTSFASIKDSKPVLVEDFYYEKLDDKVWSIMEEGGAKQTKFNMRSTLESIDAPDRQISTLTKRGITHYNKQRITDYLQYSLQSMSPEHLNKFEERYGAIETCYVAHMLACSSKQTPQVIDFIRQSAVQQEGMLLYFARIVKDIWTIDLKSQKAPKESFMAVQERLRTLANIYQQHDIPAIDGIDLVLKTIEFISLLCFANGLEWEQIVARLDSNWPVSKFCDIVTTSEGHNLIQLIVYKAIETSKLANASNNYNFIGSFLDSNCSNLLGTKQVIYFKGVENLYAAQNNTDDNDKKQSLALALHHFKSVVSICDAPRVKALLQQFCHLGDHNSAVELAFTNYSQAGLTYKQVQTLVLDIINQAIGAQNQEYAIDVVTNALKMTSDQNYHYEIYEWLANHEHNPILASLKTSTLFDFINTHHTLDPRQRLILLELYYAHRSEFAKSADTVYQLATEADQVGLLQRVQALKKACEYLPQADGFSQEKCQAIQRKYKVAQVQYEIFEILHEQKHPDMKVLDNLGARLVPEYDLLQCAYTQSLYEEGLSLLNTLEEYNWDFARLAWENIIQSSSTTKEQVQSKLNTLAKKLFPSISSFPVYIIYQILQANCTKFGDDFAETALLKAGVPSEVVSDAKAEFN